MAQVLGPLYQGDLEEAGFGWPQLSFAAIWGVNQWTESSGLPLSLRNPTFKDKTAQGRFQTALVLSNPGAPILILGFT